MNFVQEILHTQERKGVRHRVILGEPTSVYSRKSVKISTLSANFTASAFASRLIEKINYLRLDSFSEQLTPA